MLNTLQRLLPHLTRHLGRQNKARLGTAGDWSLGGVGAKLVGGPALVWARILAIAVQDVEDDDAEVVEGAEAMTSWKGFPVLEPFHLGEKKYNIAKIYKTFEFFNYSYLKMCHNQKWTRNELEMK